MKKLTLRKQTVAALDSRGLDKAGGGYVDYAAAVLRIPSMGCTRPGGGGGMTGINPSQGCDNGCGDDGNY
ncbi:MAG: hypothetical protein KBG28_06760 [Kofleriaceae bacterium]|jgi:hypothetical protein|nr:hypothetical protein [Kofleriaceae bacterium]MBP9203643.1 hypothetical protein [Kofleriaceae bacterium]